ncbi:hypothetical protein ACTXMK_14225 [Psychrobacter celer]|uniref:hypothetical protein n=1 Tax=Psychrobacter celer TaxID=306572 RepID=UPI003FCFA8CC
MYLVGFSINKLTIDPDWTIKRRQDYLINKHVIIPKSVDANVWEEVHNIDKMTGEDIVYNLPKWKNKDLLIENTLYDISQKDNVLSTFILFSEEVAFDEYPKINSLNNLFFLGYDVADEGATSGLSNCSYTPSELDFCVEKFGFNLNKHGLFENLDIANEFTEYTNTREPQHAPFYIYGIYTDKEIHV